MHTQETANPEEFRALVAAGALRTLADALAYCVKMERENPERSDAWRNQYHSFIANNPSRRRSSPQPKARSAGNSSSSNSPGARSDPARLTYPTQ